jgi:hypothetical protein
MPYNSSKDVIHIALYSDKEQVSENTIVKFSKLVPKRDADRVWLCWGFNDANADIDYLKMNRLKRVSD